MKAMRGRENAFGVDPGATTGRGSLLGAALVLGVMLAPRPTLATTLTVTGGPGLDQGQICVTGLLCPGNPTFSLSGTAPVSGSFTYNPGPQTVDFTLTLTANASFLPAALLAGSTFSATGVPVIAVPFGTGIQVVQFGAATALASPLLISPALPVLANTPDISGLTCSIGTGADQCGLSLGPGGLQIQNPGGGSFSAFVSFNTNVVPVPAAAWLFGSALGLLGIRRRKLATD
jgi:hypothetical protein